MTSSPDMQRTRSHRPRDAAGLLALAASPVFGLMAGITASEGAAMALCGSTHGIVPIDGMTMMYLLMSLFHLSPWLGLVSSRRRDRTLSNGKGD